MEFLFAARFFLGKIAADFFFFKSAALTCTSELSESDIQAFDLLLDAVFFFKSVAFTCSSDELLEFDYFEIALFLFVVAVTLVFYIVLGSLTLTFLATDFFFGFPYREYF